VRFIARVVVVDPRRVGVGVTTRARVVIVIVIVAIIVVVVPPCVGVFGR
jgi:hypothetical protein